MTCERWEAIVKAADSRKKFRQYMTSKYRPIIDNLPTAPAPGDGYHRHCYSTFTAVKRTSVLSSEQDNSSNTGISLRSASPASTSHEKSRLGIFDERCLYCDKKWKTRNDGSKEGLGMVQSKDAENKIREAANLLKDVNVESKISGIDLISKEVRFHHSCRSQKIAAATRLKEREQMSSSNQRDKNKHC